MNPALLLLRHQLCDWGDLEKEDKCTNDEALKSGGRLLSSYNVHGPDHRDWIITEWDRSVTTILLPEEYCPVLTSRGWDWLRCRAKGDEG